MRKTYHGGCHCGAVRFSVDVDIRAGTVKCNCTICLMMRQYLVKAAPAHFTLLRGHDDLTDYHFGSHVAHHQFCRHCGIRPFDRVDLPPPRTTYYNIAVQCLEDLDIDELMAAPVAYEDGRNDDWLHMPAEIRHL